MRRMGRSPTRGHPSLSVKRWALFLGATLVLTRILQVIEPSKSQIRSRLERMLILASHLLRIVDGGDMEKIDQVFSTDVS